MAMSPVGGARDLERGMEWICLVLSLVIKIFNIFFILFLVLRSRTCVSWCFLFFFIFNLGRFIFNFLLFILGISWYSFSFVLMYYILIDRINHKVIVIFIILRIVFLLKIFKKVYEVPIFKLCIIVFIYWSKLITIIL